MLINIGVSHFGWREGFIIIIYALSSVLISAEGQTINKHQYLESIVHAAMDAMTPSDREDTMALAAADMNGTVKAVSELLEEIPELPSTVDCFGLPSWIATPIRNLFKLSSSSVVNTRFYLSTRTNQRHQEIWSGDSFSLNDTGFNPKHQTFIIVHGFMADGQDAGWIHEMVTALLDRNDSNVFAVDWSGGGGSWKYWKAVANTRVTGNDLTRFVIQLIEAGISKENLHLIGHSLGAHICGFVSRNLKGVGRITGLDPAQPCFRVSDPRMTLHKSDATFVDVVHTNGKILSRLGLGLPYDIGHVDFFPNGGMNQPGCRVKGISYSVIHHITRKLRQSVCSHGRAYEIFIESIQRNDDCTFWGHPWNRTKKDLHKAMERPCDSDICTEMGINTEIYSARGSFYIHTREQTPFCEPSVKTDKEMGMIRPIHDVEVDAVNNVANEDYPYRILLAG